MVGIHHFWRDPPPNHGTGLLILGQHCGHWGLSFGSSCRTLLGFAAVMWLDVRSFRFLPRYPVAIKGGFCIYTTCMSKCALLGYKLVLVAHRHPSLQNPCPKPASNQGRKLAPCCSSTLPVSEDAKWGPLGCVSKQANPKMINFLQVFSSSSRQGGFVLTKFIQDC